MNICWLLSIERIQEMYYYSCLLAPLNQNATRVAAAASVGLLCPLSFLVAILLCYVLVSLYVPYAGV
jgi:hypothetical protein